MKKTTIIASLAVLASAATLTAFALGGAGKFGDVRVNADPVEYSVTFDESNKTTVEAVGNNYAICTTTVAGNKVGMMGRGKTTGLGLTVCGVKFNALLLYGTGAGVYDFGHITGFTAVFDGGDLTLVWEDENGMYDGNLESGKRFNVTCTPSGNPQITGYGTTVTSLTVHYIC